MSEFKGTISRRIPRITKGFVGVPVNEDNLKSIFAFQQLPASLVTSAFREKHAHTFLPSCPFEGGGMVMAEGRWTHSSLYHSGVQAQTVLPRSLHHPQEGETGQNLPALQFPLFVKPTL